MVRQLAFIGIFVGIVSSVPFPPFFGRLPPLGGLKPHLLQTLAGKLPWMQHEEEGVYEAKILSSLYGYNDCIGGVNDFDTEEEWFAELRRRNCTVVTDPRSGETVSNVPGANLLAIACGHPIAWKDGMPVVFNFPLIGDPLPTMFEVELSDGSLVTPECVVLGPANEGNELDTVLFIGELGDGVAATLNPVKINVVGDIKLQGPDGEISAQGISFSNPGDMEYLPSSVRMVYARLWDVAVFDEAPLPPIPGPPGMYPNYCQSLFPSTSHVLRVAFSGGITLDGVTGVEPSNRELFQVLNPLTDEQVPYLGLADLGNSVDGVEGQAYVQDGDNYIDLCLSLPALPPSLAVSLTCNPEGGSSLYPPKGKPFTCVSDQVVLTQAQAWGYYALAWQTE